MEKGTTYVALDDSKRKLVAGILRPGVPEPELRDIDIMKKVLIAVR